MLIEEPVVPVTAKVNVVNQKALEELERLYNRGLITLSEYENRKKLLVDQH